MMEPITPKGLSQEELAHLRLGAACDCMCSADQLAGARGSGFNSDTCGCFCSDPESATNNANKNTATNKQGVLFTEIFAEISRLKESLKE